jgi:hypothetical protein
VGGPGALIAYRTSRGVVDAVENLLRAKKENFQQAQVDLHQALNEFRARNYRASVVDTTPVVVPTVAPAVAEPPAASAEEKPAAKTPVEEKTMEEAAPGEVPAPDETEEDQPFSFSKHDRVMFQTTQHGHTAVTHLVENGGVQGSMLADLTDPKSAKVTSVIIAPKLAGLGLEREIVEAGAKHLFAENPSLEKVTGLDVKIIRRSPDVVAETPDTSVENEAAEAEPPNPNEREDVQETENRQQARNERRMSRMNRAQRRSGSKPPNQ